MQHLDILGYKSEDKSLNISHNIFKRNENQRKEDCIELYVCGGVDEDEHIDPKGEIALVGGTISYNQFDGSARECMFIRTHSKMTISHNIINDVGFPEDTRALGLCFPRGYRSVISHNIVNGANSRGLKD